MIYGLRQDTGTVHFIWVVELQKIYHSHLDAPNFLVTKPLSEFDILWSFSSQDIKSLGDLGGFRIFWIYYSKKHQRSETHLTTCLKLIPYLFYTYILPHPKQSWFGKVPPLPEVEGSTRRIEAGVEMFGIFEVYTYERLYNPSTYLFICIYIYTNLNWWVSLPEIWSINRLSNFLGKRCSGRCWIGFFPGLYLAEEGRSVCLKCWIFSPWSMWWNSFFFFIGEGNFKQDVKGNCWYIYIYICGVRWLWNFRHFYIVMCCNRFFERGSNKNVLKSERTTEMTRLKFLFSFTVSSWIQCCF